MNSMMEYALGVTAMLSRIVPVEGPTDGYFLYMAWKLQDGLLGEDPKPIFTAWGQSNDRAARRAQTVSAWLSGRRVGKWVDAMDAIMMGPRVWLVDDGGG